MEIEALKYNYIVCGDLSGLYNYSYADLGGYDNIFLVPSFKEKLGKWYPLFKLHTAHIINRRIFIPFKYVWFPKFFSNRFENRKPICFLFFEPWSEIACNWGLIDYLKIHFQECKTVCFFHDLVGTKKQIYIKKPIDINKYQNTFDLILSFDHKDSERYNLVYHPLVFSSLKGVINDMPMSDVYFLGKPKNRLSEIYEVYELLRNRGLKLDFYLVGVSKEARKFPNDIQFIDNMPYGENLQHVLHSRCLLEIMQHGGEGFTQRTMEAICLGKKLLTNNQNIKKVKFYDADRISTFTSTKDIDVNFLSNIPKTDNVDYNYNGEFSPIELIHFIDERV